MAKNTVGDWSTTAGNNSDVGGINIAEGTLAANINNAIREIMAQVATLNPKGATELDADYQAKDATLTSIAALGTAANKGLYTTGVDTWAEMDVTAAGRALLDDADAAAQRTTLGLGTAATVDVIDEDSFATDSATRPPSQQSTKAYVDASLQVKAWVNFNGTGTVAINASFNVSSITDNGTGNYTINFTNAMTDTDYSWIGTARRTATGSSFVVVGGVVGETKTVSALQISTFLQAGGTSAAVDPPEISLSVIR